MIDLAKRGRRPDYLHGGGTISPLTSLNSHFRTFACGTPLPASISASASSIARASISESISSNTLLVSDMSISHRSLIEKLMIFWEGASQARVPAVHSALQHRRDEPYLARPTRPSSPG